MVESAHATPVLYSFPDSAALSDALAQYIIKSQNDAIERRGKFTVAISGGSLPKMLHRLIDHPDAKWDYWRVYYTDERAVPLDHPDSNHKLCKDELYSKAPIPEEHIHPINPALLDDLEELAADYEQQLVSEFAAADSARFPRFDLILLGVGPDGHTASLFPSHLLLSKDDCWVAYLDDSPKPPPRRITLTLPVLNHATRVAFVASGAGKVDVLHTILDDPAVGLPSSRVRPKLPGRVCWFVDDEASSKVQYTRSQLKL